MSEVDRLSNSGLYPALPIADKRGGSGGSRGGEARRARDDKRATDDPPAPSADGTDSSAEPRPPKSLIDEYA
jgi:hypothetical protein